MKRITSVLSGLLLLLTATVAFSDPYNNPAPLEQTGGANAASRSCQTALDSNSYNCMVKSSFGAPFTDCYQFGPPSVSSHFDMLPIGLGHELGCSCDPTGSFKNPKFNGSPNAFDCVGTDGTEEFDFAGKVTSSKISGHISADSGDSFVFSCTKRSTSCP
jgi:hypothetical protein